MRTTGVDGAAIYNVIVENMHHHLGVVQSWVSEGESIHLSMLNVGSKQDFAVVVSEEKTSKPAADSTYEWW